MTHGSNSDLELIGLVDDEPEIALEHHCLGTGRLRLVECEVEDEQLSVGGFYEDLLIVVAQSFEVGYP